MSSFAVHLCATNARRAGLIIALTTICGVLLPLACRRGTPAASADQGLIFLIGQSELNPQWPGMAGAVRRIKRELPQLRCEALTTPVETDLALAALVQTALARKPSAICLFVT